MEYKKKNMKLKSDQKKESSFIRIFKFNERKRKLKSVRAHRKCSVNRN